VCLWRLCCFIICVSVHKNLIKEKPFIKEKTPSKKLPLMKKLNTVILLSAVAVGSASAQLVTTTTFDGAGSFTDVGNWDNGLPTNLNPGLVSATSGSTWTSNAWTDLAIRQTGGTVGGAGSSVINMRGGALGSGNKTIYEIEDVANSEFGYNNLEVSGQLTMWNQNGQGQELSLLAGYATVGSLNAISSAATSTINIGDGKLDIGLLDTAKVGINMLAGGTGEIVIGDRNGDKFNSMRLDFETGNLGSITLSTNLGASTGGYWQFFIGQSWASIGGVVVTDLTQFNIVSEGLATTISLASPIPEPGTYAMLAGCCALTFVMLRRRG
jgi:hypothetical protein